MSHPASDPTGRSGRLRRRSVVVVAVAASAVGLLLGVLVGGLVAGSGDGAGTEGRAVPTTGAPAPSPGGPGDVEVRIDEACLQALDAAGQAYDTVEGIGQALADLDAARLDEVIHRLQPLDRQLREGADDCEVATRRSGASTAPGAPPTAASPSASPGG